MGGLKLPSPGAREVMRTFLNEACDHLHVEGLEFVLPPSGMALKIHYRDVAGHSHRKMLVNPDARNFSDIEDMIVMASEWLSHGTSRALDAAKVTMQ